MVDGVDVLFRIAFAVLRVNEQELMRCTSIPAVYVALESLPNRMWEADKLLQVSLESSSMQNHVDESRRRRPSYGAPSHMLTSSSDTNRI